MKAIALSLKEDELPVLAGYVSELPVQHVVATVQGDLNRGRMLYKEGCIDCHRYNASGEETFFSPPLTGLPDWYLKRQIENFRSGLRGALPEDERGQKMMLECQRLMGSNDAADLVVYIRSLAE